MKHLPFIKGNRQAIIFMGIQASGKTTFYNRMLSDGTYIHISLDDLHTRNKEEQALMECLRSGKSFIIDNTNPEVAIRAKYIRKAKEYGYHVIGLFFQSIVKDCVRRNEEREVKVPATAIANTSNRLQMPTMEEGFDELFYVRIDNDDFELSAWRD